MQVDYSFKIIKIAYVVFFLVWFCPIHLYGQDTKPSISEPQTAVADFFPIMPWDPVWRADNPAPTGKDALTGIAECNFTVAGFVQPEDLQACEKLGLKAIVASPRDFEPPTRATWQKLTDEQIDQRIKITIDRAGNSPAILGYYIIDEPGSPLFPALAKAVAAVKKYAPGKLAYINLYPGYATIGSPDMSQLGTNSFTEYLERYVNEVKPQFLSYDNYMVQMSDDLQQAGRTASYFRDLMEVRRVAIKYDLPFWNIVSSNQIRAFTTIPSPANLMLQAYTTLAAGGKGVTWFTYFGRKGGYQYTPIDVDGNRTNTWRYLQLVNHHLKILGPRMNRLKSTGVYYTSPAPADKLPPLPGKLVTTVESRISTKDTAAEHPPIMVGEFTGDDGADYVMVVNLSLTRSANVVLATAKAYKSRQYISAEDGKRFPLDEKNGHWLVAGQGVLIRLAE